MLIRVIVPAHNEEKNIVRNLASIASAPIPVDIDFYCNVVVNGSQDKTFELAKTFALGKSRVSVENLVDGHKAKAINHVLKDANEDTICVVMDSDTLISENFISEVSRLFSNPQIHSLGALYVPILDSLPKGTFLSTLESLELIGREVNPYALPIGRFCAFRKKDISLLPEDIHSEDLFIVFYSLLKFGWDSVVIAKSIISSYYPPKNWSEAINQRTRWQHGSDQFMEKYPEFMSVKTELDKKREEARDIVYSEGMKKVKELGIDPSVVENLLFIRTKLVTENATLTTKLVNEDGTWYANPSTKG